MLLLMLSLVASAPVGLARDTPKTKPVGSLSHSIINLGRMHINLYINDKKDKKALEELLYPNYQAYPHSHESARSQFEIIHPSRSQAVLRSDPFTKECPCTNMRAATQHGPPDLLSRILMNNDLFSFRNDPANSPLCCTSHEQIQEEFIIEFGPKANPSQNQMRSPQNSYTQPQQVPQLLPKAFPYLPFLKENFQNKAITGKPSKQIDIFLFPTKKVAGKMEPKVQFKPIAKSDIQMVGDKKTTMLLDITPTKSSVKKDLTKEKVDTGIDTAETVKVTVDTNGNKL